MKMKGWEKKKEKEPREIEMMEKKEKEGKARD